MIQTSSVDISIIIVNHNLERELENCLSSFLPQILADQRLTYEVLIVDNHSSTDALRQLEKKFMYDFIHYYYLDENIGFGQGCNYAFTKSRGKYVCFLNPDTILTSNIFYDLYNFLENHSEVGIVAPKQQQSKCFDFSAGFSPNIFYEIFGVIGLNIFIEGMLMNCYCSIRKKDFYHVNWVLGACLFMKADIFRLVRGFSKEFFMFYEEVDLCKKVREKGYEVVYRPGIEIKHIGSVSGRRNYFLYTVRTYSSKYIFINKYFSGIKLYVLNILLRLQTMFQIILWLSLYCLNEKKSKEKIQAFKYLLKNSFKNKIDIPRSVEVLL